MGKDARIKRERKIEKIRQGRLNEMKKAEILIELSQRGEEYDKLFIEQFGKLDKEGDFEDADDKTQFIKDRIEFWESQKDKYKGKTIDDLSDVDINDLRILDNMKVDYHKLAKKYELKLED